MDELYTHLTPQQQAELLTTLKARFESHPNRHGGIAWQQVQSRLESQPEKLWSLYQMENTGGEPDLIGYDAETAAYLFVDCSAESPHGRRSLCYDDAALQARKANKPAGSAAQMAAAMGVELLTETHYRTLQTLGEFDAKSSSWVQTPPEIRKLGGALFCDRRYNTVFVYHNGADSYYAARGFRAALKV